MLAVGFLYIAFFYVEVHNTVKYNNNISHDNKEEKKMKYYSTFKRKGILPFATTWLDLEDIILSDIIRHRKTL